MEKIKEKVTRIQKDIEQIVNEMLCSECEEVFIYGTGFPAFCPECGVEFLETADAEND